MVNLHTLKLILKKQIICSNWNYVNNEKFNFHN